MPNKVSASVDPGVVLREGWGSTFPITVLGGYNRGELAETGVGTHRRIPILQCYHLPISQFEASSCHPSSVLLDSREALERLFWLSRWLSAPKMRASG